jgi:hypothetical protein
MEVHHHSHTARKKWTHYFWEFLMLFLAVFCGFLAEYQLEHKIEKDREYQYMQSFLEDLRSDTTQCNTVIDVGQKQLLVLDSLIDLINNESTSNDNIARLYMLAANSGRIINVTFENRTSSQLKNAGGLRLVRKKVVADSIPRYWTLVSVCESISARLETGGNERINVSVQLFHNKYYIRENKPLAPVTGIKKGVQLIKTDPALLAEYSNRCFSRKLVLTNYLNVLAMSKQRATRLMEQIKEAYHLQ